jgi:hypothetical protein
VVIKEAAELALNAPSSHSKYAKDGLTKNLQKWQDEGFYTVSNGDPFEHIDG